MSVPFVDGEDFPTKYKDSPEFEILKEEIVTQLFEINGQISTLQQFITTLNSLLNKGDVNAKVIENIDKKSVENIRKVGSLIKNVNEVVHKIDAIEGSDLDKTQVIAREKIVRDVRYSLQEFQNTQRQYTSVIKQINARAKAALDLEEQEQQNDSAMMQEEEQQQQQIFAKKSAPIVIEREPINNEEFAYQENLIRQRDHEITNIEEGITELNEIFKDLGAVVQQQGILVDNIEANIYSATDNAAMASRELNKAQRSQRNTNKWCLYMLFGVSFMLILLLLVVFI